MGRGTWGLTTEATPISELLPIIQADAQRIPLADESVQCVVTSPPYYGLRKNGGGCATIFDGDGSCPWQFNGMRLRRKHRWKISRRPSAASATSMMCVGPPSTFFERGYQLTCKRCGAWYGELGHEPTPQLYIEHLVAIFAELRRVLRRDGCCFVVMGDSYASGQGTCHNPGGTGNPRVKKAGVYPLDRGSVQSLRTMGLKPKDLIGIPWMLAFAMRDDGWWLRQDNVWAKPNPMPESVRDRTTRSHEYVFHFSKAAKYFYDTDAVSEPWAGDTSRRLWQPDLDAQMGGYKAEAYEADFPGRKQRDRRPADILRAMRDGNKCTKNLRSVWRVNTEPWPDAHFATFPREIARRCILAGSSPTACGICGAPWQRIRKKTGRQNERRRTAHVPGHNETKQTSTRWEPTEIATGRFEPTCKHKDASGRCVVLDPFCGSGTTVEVAWSLKRVGIGIDLVERYCREHAVKRFRRGYAEGRQMALALDG